MKERAKENPPPELDQLPTSLPLSINALILLLANTSGLSSWRMWWVDSKQRICAACGQVRARDQSKREGGTYCTSQHQSHSASQSHQHVTLLCQLHTGSQQYALSYSKDVWSGIMTLFSLSLLIIFYLPELGKEYTQEQRQEPEQG